MNIVVIGGGTGSFVVLSGLKKYDVDITAVVSMFDNGGSTGALRDEFGVLPPGDIRRCLVALSDEQSILRKLFMYRFEKDSSLNGHSFGNLFLTALSQISNHPIKDAARILKIKGNVLPVSFTNSNLCAKFENGSVVEGETLIDIPERDPNLRIVDAWLSPSAVINPEVINTVSEADLVVIAPGDLYTSIVPNLLVEGMVDVLKDKKIVYVCNLMTKPGETSNFKASDHLSIIQKFCKPSFVICNKSSLDPELLKFYASKGQHPVECDIDAVFADVASDTDLVRHDSDKLAKVILGLEEFF